MSLCFGKVVIISRGTELQISFVFFIPHLATKFKTSKFPARQVGQKA